MNLYINAAEKRLETALGNLKNSNGFVGLCFNLSRLSQKKENDEHISIAANVLRDQLKSCIGDIYAFSDGDIIVVHKGNNPKMVNESIYQLRYLFAEDPLAFTASGKENEKFCKIFDTENTWPNFIKLCRQKIANDNAINENPRPVNSPILAALSNYIEEMLSQVNFEKIIQIHPICINPFEKKPKTVISEIRVNTLKLKQQLDQDLDVLYNPHLFGYIREFLDIRSLIKLLELLNKDDKSAYYLNLSILSLNSEEFTIFDEAISESAKKSLIIGLHISDVYKDLAEYFEVKERLQSKGYKLCLHGLDSLSFLHIDRESLGFDLLNLRFESHKDYSEIEQQLKNKIQVSGSSRIILSGCYSERSLSIGRKLGISLFQGSGLNLN